MNRLIFFILFPFFCLAKDSLVEDIYNDQFIHFLHFLYGEGNLAEGEKKSNELLIKNLKLDNSTILDFGCGTGGVAHFIAELSPSARIFGLDIAPSCIEIAKKQFPKNLYPNIDFVISKSKTLPFPNQFFDYVFAKEVFIHIDQKAEILQEIYRVLKPGGQIVIIDWMGNLEESPKTEDLIIHLSSIKAFKNFLSKAGLREVSELDCTGDYREFLTDTLGKTSQFMEKLKENWRDYVIAKDYNESISKLLESLNVQKVSATRLHFEKPAQLSKTVLISGATSGIGLATAKAFQKQGWTVWAGYRQKVPKELERIDRIFFCPLDVTDEQQVHSAVEMVLSKSKRIDALINNAGYGLIGAEECVTIDEAKQLFDVNFFGCLRLIQEVVPIMRQQKSGHIINISSCLGVRSIPGLGIYSASKFALEALSESLSASLSNWGIKVSILEPGPVYSPWGSRCARGTRKCKEDFYDCLAQRIEQMLASPCPQTTEEIARQLVKIAEGDNPALRFQTNPATQKWVAEKLKDPTGLNVYEENLHFIRDRISY